MSIEVSFLIKHVRPYDLDAYNAICAARGANTLYQWLFDHGVAENEISTAFNFWEYTASLPLERETLPLLIESANIISQARWSELYTTPKSTILFLTEPVLRELSLYSEQYPAKQFKFLPQEYIPLAVTIHNDPKIKPEVHLNVEGAYLSADNEGRCHHFVRLIA